MLIAAAGLARLLGWGVVGYDTHPKDPNRGRPMEDFIAGAGLIPNPA